MFKELVLDELSAEQWWAVPAMPPPIVEGGVQVWRIRLGETESSRQEMRAFLDRACAMLTLPERRRAARTRLGAPREEFVAGRGCLRRLMGAALDTDPRTLAIETGAHGKPQIKPDCGIDFNVAHSKGVVLIALSRAGAVGVDVECLDPAVELVDVARTAFHAADLARIELAPTQDDRLREFYRCWTRKEAILKADGRGLTAPLDEFPVGEGVAKIAAAGVSYEVRNFRVGVGHLAALALAQDALKLGFFDLNPRSPFLFAE